MNKKNKLDTKHVEKKFETTVGSEFKLQSLKELEKLDKYLKGKYNL